MEICIARIAPCLRKKQNKFRISSGGEILETKFEKIKTITSKNPQVLISGYGYNVATAMRNISEQLRKAEEDFILQKMKEELGVIDIESSLTTMVTSSFMAIIDESTFESPKTDISSLKKRIKYCKNPMEKKKLQQELNALYKEQKRRK